MSYPPDFDSRAADAVLNDHRNEHDYNVLYVKGVLQTLIDDSAEKYRNAASLIASAANDYGLDDKVVAHALAVTREALQEYLDVAVDEITVITSELGKGANCENFVESDLRKSIDVIGGVRD